MPNWCHNTLRVQGDESDVFRWTRQARTPSDPQGDDGSPLYFSSFVPEPTDIGEGWWDWRIENWGTKWEPSFSEPMVALGASNKPLESMGHPDVRRGEGFAEYTFDTAWGPPLEWIQKVSAQYPALTFSTVYGEPGMDFGGKITFVAGEVLRQEEGGAGDFLQDDMMWF